MGMGAPEVLVTAVDMTDVELEGLIPCKKLPVTVHAMQIDVPFTVKTLEGIHEGKAGDYLLVGVEGERYPVKKEIFEKTYQFVEGG
jgi:hypothetical protein